MNPQNGAILLCGSDAALLRTRHLVIESHGYCVMSVHNVSQIDALPPAPPVQLVILCHSLDTQTALEALDRANLRWPGVKSLFIVESVFKPSTQKSSEVVLALDGPLRLLSAIAAMVGGSPSRGLEAV